MANDMLAGAEPEKPKEVKKKDAAKLLMNVRVASPFKVYFDGEASSISGLNGAGPFDVLPRHHNFISLLEPCDLTIRTASGESQVKISGGIMHVKQDEVAVFLNV